MEQDLKDHRGLWVALGPLDLRDRKDLLGPLEGEGLRAPLVQQILQQERRG